MADRSVRSPFAELGGSPGGLVGEGWQPAVDVVETEKALVVRVELAGVPRDRVRVTVTEEQLVVRGERLPEALSGEVRPHQVEIAFGPFERRLALPGSFECERVTATLDDGMLTIVVPRQTPAQRRVEIEEA